MPGEHVQKEFWRNAMFPNSPSTKRFAGLCATKSYDCLNSFFPDEPIIHIDMSLVKA